jgi:hypothetical protein
VGGRVCYALYSQELMSLMYYLFVINEDLIPFQKKKKAERLLL